MNEEHKRLESVVYTVLKASRVDSDVSQKELARRLHLTRNVSANIEAGRAAVLMADFVMISRALRIDPERLLHRIL
jgi:transcriptional regulator with XRE-family HTH domain